MNEQRLTWHLDNWAEWQRHTEIEGGYPRKACGGMGKSGSSDFDTMVAEVDTRCAFAADAVIDDLPAAQRSALYARHLGGAWRFPGAVDEHYARAQDALGRGLDRRGIF